MDKDLNTTFSALGDPTRRAMLQRLTQGPASVGELARPFPVSVQAISKHLRVLERSGLVRIAKSGRERIIELDPVPLHAADAWLSSYRLFWEARLDALCEVLKEQDETFEKDG